MKKSKLIGLAALLFALGVTGCGNNDNPGSDNPGEDQPGEQQPAACEHTYGAWTTTKAATCKAKGEKEQTCSKCGDVKKEAIDKDANAHKWVDDAASDKEATCDEAGVTGSKKCELCGEKKAGSAVAAKGHNFVAEGAKDGVVQKYVCSTDQTVAYVLDVADATGWHDATTKMNGKTSPNNKAAWDITGKLPAGNYEVEIEGKMSSDSHSVRKWYNMAIADLMVEGDEADNATGNPADADTEDPYRYFITVGDQTFNPETKKSWGELGFEGGSSGAMKYGHFIDNIEIKEDSTELALNHGSIGYSFICSKLRLIYHPEPVEVEWNALNDLDASSVGIEKNTDYIRFDSGSVRDSSGAGTGCIAVYKINSPRAVAKAELWFDAQSHSGTTSMFGAQSNDNVKGYVSDGKGGWVNPSDYRMQVRVNGQPVAFTADNNAAATSTRDWYKFTLADFALTSGENTIEIENTGGYRAKIYGFKLVEVK